MADWRFETLAGLVLLGCAGLLGEVAWSELSRAPMLAPTQEVRGPQQVGADPQAGVAPLRDLERHLPLAGMPDARSEDPDACRRLEGFVVDSVHELRERGLKPPFAPELLKAALDSGRCGIDGPEVAQIMAELGAAYAQAGLDVSAPMRLVD
jgi:hypothetical protein